MLIRIVKTGIVFLLFLTVLPTMFSHTDSMILAQETDETLYYWIPGGVWRIDPITLNETLYFEYDPPPDGAIIDIQLDLINNFLYVIEIGESPYAMNDHDLSSEVIQIDLQTGKRELIWAGLNLITPMILSPDGNKALVFYLDGLRDEPRRHTCLLDITNRQCDDINIPSSKFEWLDERTVAYINSQGEVCFLDVVTLEESKQKLAGNWSFLLTDIIETQEVLLVNAIEEFQRGSYFILYDLNTGQILETLAHQPFNIVVRMYGSPNGNYFHYVLYEQFIIVKIESGEYLAYNFTARWEEWFPSGSSILAVMLTDTEDETIESLLYIDAVSGETEILSSHIVPTPHRIRLIAPLY